MLGLPALFVGTVYSLSQIFYSLILPFFGNLSDQLRNSRFGTRTPLIIVGIPGLILIYYLIWNIPPSTQFGILEPKTAFYFFLLLFLYRLFFACIWASYQAMIPDLTKSEKEQMNFMSYLNIFSYIGQVLGTMLPVIILTKFPFPESASSDYFWFFNSNGIGIQIQNSIHSHLLLLCILCIVCFISVLFFVPVPKKVINSNGKRNDLKISWYKNFQNFLKDKSALYLTLNFTLIIIATGSLNFILINFSVYILQLGNYFTFFSAIVIIVSLSSFFLSGFLAQRFGLKRLLITGSIVFVIAFPLMALLLLNPFILLVQIGICIIK